MVLPPYAAAADHSATVLNAVQQKIDSSKKPPTVDEVIQYMKDRGFNLMSREMFVGWLRSNFGARIIY